jgi:hypothetical protein
LYSIESYQHETKTRAFIGTHNETSKMVTGSEKVKHFCSFNYLSCNISYLKNMAVKVFNVALCMLKNEKTINQEK